MVDFLPARICLLLLGLCVSAATVAAPDIQHWLTKNGARVYFVAAHELPMVSISLAFDAGSARDPGNRLGLAHLTNTLMEEGAGDRSGEQISEGLESIGAQLQSNNGRDMSVFELRTLSDPNVLDTSVGILGDVIGRPQFPAAALERERDRVLVALQRQQQSPRDLVRQVFFKSLFAGHPYSKPPMGEAEGVKAIVRQDLIDFHRRYFVAANGVVAIVGDLNRQRAEQIAQRLVAALPRGGAAPGMSDVSQPAGPRESSIDFPSQQSHLLMGQPGVARGDPDYFPLYVGNHILGGSGLISRLAVEIREKRGLAYSAYSYFVAMRARGPFAVGLQTRNDQLETAADIAAQTLVRFVEQGPTAQELEAAKKNITGGFPLLIDSNSKIADYLMHIGFYELPLNYLQEYPANIEAVTVDDVTDAFRRRVDPKRLVRVIVGDNSG